MSKETQQGRIYWIWVEDTAIFKIGFTSRPIKERLAAIQAGCPFMPMRLIARVLGTYEEEQALHRTLRAYRIGGREWYRLPDKAARAVAMAFQCRNVPGGQV